MKKVVLSLAIVAAMFVSCKETATEGNDTMDSVTVEVEAPVTEEVTVDSTTVEVEVPVISEEAAPAN
ncbi:hypothetical protein ACFSX9_14230 [Flavobacterium ardleyense]|uniref:Lipoprotein n=1 Tax=Flavobacterium ardleyense TaxID=2038737 RepID=A0ABW5ZCU3_9FLAO